MQPRASCARPTLTKKYRIDSRTEDSDNGADSAADNGRLATAQLSGRWRTIARSSETSVETVVKQPQNPATAPSSAEHANDDSALPGKFAEKNTMNTQTPEIAVPVILAMRVPRQWRGAAGGLPLKARAKRQRASAPVCSGQSDDTFLPNGAKRHVKLRTEGWNATHATMQATVNAQIALT